MVIMFIFLIAQSAMLCQRARIHWRFWPRSLAPFSGGFVARNLPLFFRNRRKNRLVNGPCANFFSDLYSDYDSLRSLPWQRGSLEIVHSFVALFVSCQEAGVGPATSGNVGLLEEAPCNAQKC